MVVAPARLKVDGLSDPTDYTRREYRYLVGSGQAQRTALEALRPQQKDYQVSTLYLDKPGGTWSIGVSQTKFRLRHYNDEHIWYFETKHNVAGAVDKHREQVTAAEIDATGLRPILAISYDRTEFQFPRGPDDPPDGEGFRATLDRNVTVYQVASELPPSQAMDGLWSPLSVLDNLVFEVKPPNGVIPVWLPLPQKWPGSKSRWGLAALHGVSNMWAPSHRP